MVPEFSAKFKVMGVIVCQVRRFFILIKTLHELRKFVAQESRLPGQDARSAFVNQIGWRYKAIELSVC